MRLIDADVLEKNMYHEAFEKDTDLQRWDSGCWIRYRMFTDVLKSTPSAEPRRESGNWLITDAYPHKVYCSKCFATIAQKNWHIWEDGSLPRNFCPNCGARMEV